MEKEPNKRKALSKKARFDVFKRDDFTCQYCGAVPPRVILHVDHIVPVAEGGRNHLDNLITSCEPCNLGKGARSLSDIPQSLKDKAKRTEELEEQIKGFNTVMLAKAKRIESEAWQIAARIEGEQRIESFNKENLISIKRFLERLSFSELIEAAEIADATNYQSSRKFKYFCGVCWKIIRGQNNGSF